jgi:hypothetical protein
MANTALGANVEEDMTDESRGIELKFSGISLEQVSSSRFASPRLSSANASLCPRQAKRITIAAAWRTAPPRA